MNNPQSFTALEMNAAGGPIIHTFSGDWITNITPMSGVIAFAEPGISPAVGVSDILTFTYSDGPLGGHLTGTFESDTDAGLLPLPANAIVVQETGAGGTPFTFNNGNITASAVSDVEPNTPEPASIVLLGTALLGFGFLRRRRATT